MKDLQEQATKIEQIIKKAKRAIEDSPNADFKVENKGTGQFYVFDQNQKKWVYTEKKQIEFIKKLAQRDYEKIVLKEAEKQLSAIKRFTRVYDEKFLAKVYTSLHPLRKELIKPHDITDDEYAAKWLSEKYEKNKREITTPYTTMNNDKVRSKSEALIADRLKSMGIPYRYECKLQLRNIIFYPDFTILNKRTRELVIYEHFGMMDKSEYANNCIGKLKTYTQNGFILGKNLIATFESSENPLDMNVVEQIVKQSLLTD